MSAAFAAFELNESFDSQEFEDNLIPMDQKIVNLCCCLKDAPHDETQKFQLICDPKSENIVLFKNRQKGVVT